MSNSPLKYTVFIAQNETDIQGCITVLEKVRREELNRVSGASVLDSGTFGSDAVNFKLVACRDTESGAIIGCTRLTPVSEVIHSESSRKEYALNVFPESLIPKLVISTRVAILPEHRHSQAAFLLLSSAFKFHIEAGGLAMLGTSEPSIYPMYLRLGMRPIGPMHNSKKSGYRVPLMAYLDLDHFKAISSPAYRVFAGEDETRYKEIKDWHQQFILNGFDENKVGINYYSPNEADRALYGTMIEGISLRGISRLLRNALHIHCSKGDVVIPDQDGGKFMGLVYKGSLKIEKDGRHLASLVRGQPFGELAIIRGDYRTARVIAETDDTELLILDKKALNMPSLEDELVIWKNLAKILADRLLAMNA